MLCALGVGTVNTAQQGISYAETSHGTSYYNDYDPCCYLVPEISMC